MRCEQFCKNCKYFEAGKDIDGPAIPWCNNAITKKMPNPIGWLDVDAVACQHYEETEKDVSSVVPLTTVRTEAGLRKSHSMLFRFTHIGFWICILITLGEGHYDIVFKMLMVLSFLWVLHFAKEVSADVVKGRITFTR